MIYKHALCLIIYTHTYAFLIGERLAGVFPHFLGGFGVCFSPMSTSAMSASKCRSRLVTPGCLPCPPHSQMWTVCLDSTSSSNYSHKDSTGLNNNPVSYPMQTIWQTHFPLKWLSWRKKCSYKTYIFPSCLILLFSLNQFLTSSTCGSRRNDT